MFLFTNNRQCSDSNVLLGYEYLILLWNIHKTAANHNTCYNAVSVQFITWCTQILDSGSQASLCVCTSWRPKVSLCTLEKPELQWQWGVQFLLTVSWPGANICLFCSPKLFVNRWSIDRNGLYTGTRVMVSRALPSSLLQFPSLFSLSVCVLFIFFLSFLCILLWIGLHISLKFIIVFHFSTWCFEVHQACDLMGIMPLSCFFYKTVTAQLQSYY